MSRRHGERRGLTRPERELWRHFTKTIEPLPSMRADASVQEEDAPEPVPKPAPRRIDIPKQATVKATAAPPSLEPLGRRMKQRVARGRDAIEARLDLHGMTQSDAHAALLHFLRRASRYQQKLVLVVTGKGARGAGDRGVLRRQVPHWLALPEFRAFVIGFEQAHIAHGGEGALYVRVRRARG
ncbi:MAG TPA: Smr/MutS family protein [Pseudolabrys sp.]|nr:Smr/MutS family protein [Pseudolabrys sp.]